MQPISLGSRQDAELGEFPVPERAGRQRVAGPGISSVRRCAVWERRGARRRGSDRAHPAGVRGACPHAAGPRSAAGLGRVQGPAAGLVMRVGTGNPPAGTHRDQGWRAGVRGSAPAPLGDGAATPSSRPARSCCGWARPRGTCPGHVHLKACSQCLAAAAAAAALLHAAEAGREGRATLRAACPCPWCSTSAGPAAATGEVNQRTTVTSAMEAGHKPGGGGI